jgi:Asp-tRNA(Asn)/Glu-tRNA(Gln) amidotransferase A subunit family amidase
VRRRAWVLPWLLVLLAAIALPSASGARTAETAGDCVRTVRGIDLQTATIARLERAMKAGKLTSVQLVDAYLKRIAAYDKRLDSIRQLNRRARKQAKALDAERRAGHVRGPLHGIPFLLKDNYGTADQPTTAGSIALAGVTPKHDSTVTSRLRAAGAVILGKLNLSEFAGWVDLNMPPGYSSLGGQVVNANDFEFSPSGSSAGSGVAASMAFSGATMGTETSGSILSPSDANGVVGLKTTLGLVSRFGILPLAPDFDVPGPIVRSVRDAATVLGAIAGPDPRDPATAGAAAHIPKGGSYASGLRRTALKGVHLTYSQDDVDALDDEHRALFDAGVKRLERLGATVEPSHTLGSSEGFGLTEIGAIPNEFKASLNEYLADELPTAKVHSLSDIIAYNNEHPDKVKYGQNLLQASDATPGNRALFGPQSDPARASARQSIDGALEETGAQAIATPGNAQANIGAAAGYPTVIVPLGYTGGGKDPFGLGFLGPAYSEQKLLRYAYAFERSSHARVPPTDVNPKLRPASCKRRTALHRLRVGARRHGRRLRVTVRGARARHVRVVLRHDRRVVARRKPRTHQGRAHVRIRVPKDVHGTVRVIVLDAGPPARTAHVRRRVP